MPCSISKEQTTARGKDPSAYVPIARLLHELPEDTLAKLKMKFDVAYFVATAKLAFCKYAALCQLQAHHGVNVGTEYTNEYSAKTFCHYIAKTRQQDLANNLSSAKFSSILMDSTTDKRFRE